MDPQDIDDQSLKVPGQNSEGSSLTRSTTTEDSALFDTPSQAPSSQSSDQPDAGGPSDVEKEKRDKAPEVASEDVDPDLKVKDSAPSEAGSEHSGRSYESKSEKADDSDSSENSETSSYYDEYRAKDMASRLDAKGLYDSYVLKLRRQDEKSKRPKKEKSSRLVKSFVDYVRLLEERIEQLETKVDKAAKSDAVDVVEEDQREPTPPEENAEDTKPPDDENKEAASTERWADTALETKFFTTENEFDSDGVYKWDNTQKAGSYQCNLDSKVLLRVLYNWTEELAEKPPVLAEGETPNPKHIDPLAVGITSEPIATFFSKQLDLETDTNDLVRFSKPFRPLIRNLQPLREQLAKLEGIFEYVWFRSRRSK